MTPSPDVSVVIPTRDRWNLLRRSLSSALSQLDVRVEVIIVDDGSASEAPSDLAGSWNEATRLIRHARPRGMAGARNAGIAVAQGEWLAFLDDDDLWAPTKLRQQIDVAYSSRAVFAYSDVLLVDTELRALELDPAPPPDDLLEKLLRTNRIPAGASAVIARTDVVRAAGCWDERLTVLADWDLWIRLAEAGPGAVVHEPTAAYVQHAGAMFRTPWSEIAQQMEYLARKHALVLTDHGLTPDRGTLRWYTAWLNDRSRQRRAAARGYAHAAALYLQQGSARNALSCLKDAAGVLGGKNRTLTGTRTTLDPEWLKGYR